MSDETANPLFEGIPEGIPSESPNRWERPLADRMRPRSLDEFLGQDHLVGAGAPLRRLLESGRVPGSILYGPPGVGKTTLVRLMAEATGRVLLEINAVTAKVSLLRELVDEARTLKERDGGRAAVAFVDEIYHFNKQQQNALLPSVERGDLILVGTTTENPWFEINRTLLSRLVVYEMYPLEEADLLLLLRRALTDAERGLGKLDVEADDETLVFLARSAGGDARQALTRLEVAVASLAASLGRRLTVEDLRRSLPGAYLRYDRAADDHYAVISAFIKSMRGSDPDAAVYWLGRMIASGEDLRFLARRILIFAAEDVGLADPQALVVASAAAEAADRVGYPEARIILSEAALYMALAPKSNSAYKAIDAAVADVERGELQAVPEPLRPHGGGYVYPHDDERHWVPQVYMEEIRRYYFPGSLGEEPRLAAPLKKFWRRFR